MKIISVFFTCLIVSSWVCAASIIATPRIPADESEAASGKDVASLMSELKLANKKTHWSESLFNLSGWKSHGTSVKGRPLIYFTCGNDNPNTTLMLSAVHGDEITPVYFGLRLVSWVQGEPDLCKKSHIVIAPLLNPDGFLSQPMTRTNSHGVDVNRNFPTADFKELALKRWKDDQKSDKRRFPGNTGGSEPETQFQQWLIETFHPQKILSVHSPLNFYDYDGPESGELQKFAQEYVKSCMELKNAVKKATHDYNFLRYGFFPGSLGNYSGKEKGIPTLTLELPTTDASKARGYFERLKKGTRELIVYKIKGENAEGDEAKNKAQSSITPPSSESSSSSAK